jgi:hypothetical protein
LFLFAAGLFYITNMEVYSKERKKERYLLLLAILPYTGESPNTHTYIRLYPHIIFHIYFPPLSSGVPGTTCR